MEHNIDNNNNSQYQMNLNTSCYPYYVLNHQSKGVKCLYQKYKKNFSSYLIKHKHTLRLLKDNSTLQNIKAFEYINESKHKEQQELTPLPYKSFRKYNNEKDKRELLCLERNAVMMRRIEYTHQMKVNELKRKYGCKMYWIVLIQKMIRGFIIRNIMTEIYIIKQQIEMFIVHIKMYCIINRKRKRKCEYKEQHRNNNNNKMNLKFKKENSVYKTNYLHHQHQHAEGNGNNKINNLNPDVQGINDIDKEIKLRCKRNGSNYNRSNNKLKNNSNSNNGECIVIKDKHSYGHKYCDSNNSNNTFNKEIGSFNRSPSRFQQKYSSLCTRNSTNLIKIEACSSIKSYQKHSPIKTTPNTYRYMKYSKELNDNKFNSQTTTSRYMTNKEKFYNHKPSSRNKIYNLSLNSLSPSQNKYNLLSKQTYNNVNHIQRNQTDNTKRNDLNLNQQESLFDPINKRQVPSNLKTFDIREISTNGIQFDSQNMLLSNDDNLIFEICPETFEENIETIQDDYTLTEQRANKLFPLFNSVTEDIHLINRVNKFPINNKNIILNNNDDIIENDSEVFN